MLLHALLFMGSQILTEELSNHNTIMHVTGYALLSLSCSDCVANDNSNHTYQHNKLQHTQKQNRQDK